MSVARSLCVLSVAMALVVHSTSAMATSPERGRTHDGEPESVVAELERSQSLSLEADSAERPLLRFTIPDGVEQGEPLWYLVRLELEVLLSVPVERGFAVVSASTRGKTCAQFELTPDAGGVRWTSYDLFAGPREGVSRGRTVRLSMQNYLQREGVGSGPCALRLLVERYDGFPSCDVRVLPGTAILVTSRPPDQLVVNLAPSRALVSVGKRVTLHYSVWRRDSLSGAVNLHVLHAPSLRRLHPGAQTVPLAVPATGRVTFEALAAGEFTVVVSGSDGMTLSQDRAVVRVLPPRRVSWVPDALTHLPVQLMLVGLAAAVLLLTPRVRRKRTTSFEAPHKHDQGGQNESR